jgi:hypothetical protein
VSKLGGLPIVSVALSLLLGRSAAAQVDPAPAPEVQPQVEPAAGDTSGEGDVPVPPEAPVTPPPPAPPTPAPLAAPADDGPSFGLFLAATVGVGELWIDNGTHQTWGQTVPFELSAGFAITPNVALFAAGYLARIVFPVDDLAKENTLDLRAAGLGVKVSLPRPDIFVAASTSISRLHIDYTTWPDETSRWGVLGRLSVGRQWSASPNWSLGLAGELTYGRMAWADTLPPLPGPYVAKGFSLLFSGAFGGATSGSAAGVVASEPISEGADGVHAHDGFFLNASVGLGKLWLTGGYGDDAISGGARSLDLSAGYAVAGSLVLFGAFYEIFAPNPSFSRVPLADLELHGVGPGVRYYLPPFNVFFEGALLVSRIGYHDNFPGDGKYGVNETSDWRPTARASVGWEGWVSASWGLGIACEGLIGRLPSRLRPTDDSGPSYTVKGLSLLLSASFN